jgi:hypothetical protein
MIARKPHMPVEQLTHADPAVRLKIPQSVVALKARVAELHDQLAKAKSLAAGHQTDFARERGRADKLEADLRRALANETDARLEVARLEGVLCATRSRSWWRRLLGYADQTWHAEGESIVR